MSRLRFLGLPLLISLCFLVSGSDSEIEEEWFIPNALTHPGDYTLWNECQPIKVDVRVAVYDSEMTDEEIQDVFQDRFQDKNLVYSVESLTLEQKRFLVDTEGATKDVSAWIEKFVQLMPDELVIKVMEIERRYITSFDYYRHFNDIGYGEYSAAIIWKYGDLWYDEPDKTLEEHLTELADEIIFKYLQVNKQSCEG